MNRARIAAAAAVAGALAMLPAAPAGAAAAGTGVGVSAEPACASSPGHPGGAVQLRSGGGSGTAGVLVVNQGSSAESLTLTAGPLLAGSPLAGRALPVPPSWVHVAYPRSWLVLPGHSVSVAAGASAYVPVTVTVPSSARNGVYAGSLTVSTGTGTGGVQLGAGAVTLMLFMVGITRPDWPPAVMGLTGSCWTPPGTRIPWAQWTGKPGPPPPGWQWQGPPVSAWAYTPPLGWFWSWAGGQPRQVYQGARPVRQCANPASYPNSQTGAAWIGGQYPDTGTSAACSAWLAASSAGTLAAEPALPSPGHTAGPLPQRVTLTNSASTPPPSSTSHDRELATAALLFIGALGLAVRAARWLARQRRRQQTGGPR